MFIMVIMRNKKKRKAGRETKPKIEIRDDQMTVRKTDNM